MAAFETFEHTADLGLRVRAENLDDLFAGAGLCLTSVLVLRPEAVTAGEAETFSVEGDDRADLLHDWLAELLYAFETKEKVFARFEVRLHPGGLTATAWGEALDIRRHGVNHEVKAITYHGLMVEPCEAGWMAEVIVDL